MLIETHRAPLRYKISDFFSSLLEDNPEIREEFGGRTFQSLSFQERTNLANRIREGVRSYAERVGRPFPIGSEDAPDQDGPAEK